VEHSTLAPISGAKVAITKTQIGMKRVTTANQSSFLSIDGTCTSDFAIRIKVDSSGARERAGILLQIGERRGHRRTWGAGMVSQKFSHHDAEATNKLVPAKAVFKMLGSAQSTHLN
jgi:hypothetical protein